MPRAVPLIQAFNAGELSENMAARTDQDKYRGGCKVLLNAIPVAQGPARNRAGSLCCVDEDQRQGVAPQVRILRPPVLRP